MQGFEFIRKTSKNIFFVGKAGFEEGGIGIADVNNMPVACYLARGKIPRSIDASPQGCGHVSCV